MMAATPVVRRPSGTAEPDRLLPYVARLCLSWDGRSGHRRVEGTLVSADIAGFTTLGERLADLGREGSEELTAILNDRFAAMIESVHLRGGDVLKFGGDALLCWFEGPGHAERAVHAAAKMRASLRGSVQSELAGAVKLGVSIGLHAGRHDMALIRVHDHRELVVAGPGATATIAAESAADAGEILATRASLAHLSGDGVVRERGDHIVVEPAGPDRQPGPPPVGHRRPERYLPESQRRWLEVQSQSLGEHRRVPILFVKIENTDADLRDGRPDRFIERVTATLAGIAAVCDRHGVSWLGTDVVENGIKVILGAGVPQHIRDEDAAAAWVARQILNECTEFPVRIGVHRGPVFVCNLGSDERRVYTVMGDPVNLAARLMVRADPGTALTTDDVLSRASVHVETTPQPPWLPKGKSEMVHAFTIDSLRPRMTQNDHAADVSFVGRRRELSTLRSLWVLAGHGEGHVVSLSGDAGSGKSRLVTEFVERAEPTSILRARGYFGGQARPYQYTQRPLRQALGLSEELAEDRAGVALTTWLSQHLPQHLALAPLVAPAFGASVPSTPESQAILSEFAGDRIAVVVHDVLATALRETTLFLFEDIDYADLASRALVEHLAKRAGGHPWLLVLSSRDGTLASAAATVHELEPIDTELLEALVRHGGHPLTPNRVRELAIRAGGNPLFALELGLSADATEIPENVESAVTGRLDALDVTVRGQLLDAAVLGVASDLEVLGRALSLPADADGWFGADAFVALIDGQLRYRHAVFQEVAYSLLSYRRRRELHRRVGTWLEEHRPSDRLALSGQWSASGDHRPAWRYSLLAAEDARSHAALGDTLTLYQRAMEHGRLLPDLDRTELARVAEQVGDVAELTGDYNVAAKSFEMARRWYGGALSAEVRIMRKLGTLQERRANYPQALRWYSRARRQVMERAGEAANVLLADVHVAVAGVRYRQGRYDECLAVANDAARAARLAGSDRALAHAHHLMESVYTFRGVPSEHGERALALFRRVGDDVYVANTLNNLGTAAYFAGDWDVAIERWREYVEVMESAGATRFAAVGHSNLGEILSDQGLWAEAAQHLDLARGGFEAAGYELGRLVTRSNQGRLAVRRGDPDEGIEILRSALAGFEGIGSHYYADVTRLRLAEGAADIDDGDAVIEHLDTIQYRTDADPTLAMSETRLRAHVAAIRGDLEGARELLVGLLSDPSANVYERGMGAMTVMAIGAEVHVDPRELLAPLGVRSIVRPAGHEHLLRAVQLRDQAGG